MLQKFTRTLSIFSEYCIMAHNPWWLSHENSQIALSNNPVFNKVCISPVIIHQIFSPARDWSKRVTWPNTPQLRLGNIREYSPIFKTDRVAKNIGRIINTTACIWLWKYARIFVLGHYLFLKAHSFPLRSWKTVTLEERIMSDDKYPSMFSRQMEPMVYISHSAAVICIAGFHMTSPKFELQNYWSSWDFTEMMYKSSWKLTFIQIFAPNGFLVLWYTTLEFLSFCVTRHLHDGLESCYDG